MKRFAALFLAVWLLLLMGCAASRQLEQVCGAENWSSVQLVERYDRTGEESVTLESVTLEDVYEPYLMQLGFLTRTPRGRCVTQKAYQHLHKPIPGGAAEGPLMDQLTF